MGQNKKNVILLPVYQPSLVYVNFVSFNNGTQKK